MAGQGASTNGAEADRVPLLLGVSRVHRQLSRHAVSGYCPRVAQDQKWAVIAGRCVCTEHTRGVVEMSSGPRMANVGESSGETRPGLPKMCSESGKRHRNGSGAVITKIDREASVPEPLHGD